MKRKKTLRRLPPMTRHLYKLIGEIESVCRRMENLAEKVQTVEMESVAFAKALERYQKPRPVPDEQADLFEEGGDDNA